MKAVTLTGGRLEPLELPTPQPGPGQLLMAVRRCGICGSDLHARTHADELAETLTVCGYSRYLRSHESVVLGHEFYGEVAGRGPSTTGRIKAGTPVVAIPLVRRDGQVDGIGLSTAAPGGYAEYVVVQEALTMPVPDGLAADVAALTEPMAVAWHAASRGEVTKKDVTIVLGCGPVGLAVIAVLKARGVATIIASDFSAGRRTLARACGADVVIDPAVESPWAAAGGHGFHESMTAEYDAGIDAMHALHKLPVPWWATWRLLNRAGMTSVKRPVVFECVGAPDMIDSIMAAAPRHSRIVVVGVCMSADTFRPSLAVNKELDLRFVVGYTPLEFRNTLHALAAGTIDAAPLVTGRVGLAGVPGAFETLANPETHAKILIDPGLPGTTIIAAHAR